MRITDIGRKIQEPSEFKIEHGLSYILNLMIKSIYWMLVRVIAFLKMLML